MPTSALLNRLRPALLSFAWDEWAQMGLLASPRHHSPWAQDPEALIAFTLEVARDDPRLFDEVLDWFSTNRRLISTRRLRAMCIDDEDRRLVGAVLAWSSRKTAVPDAPLEDEPVPLFRGTSGAIVHPDQAFLGHGFIRPEAELTGKSSAPSVRAPINLAFRLREMLGISARAEVVRFLLCVDAPRVTGSVLVRSAAYTKPNVYEATSALHNAGVISVVSVGSEQRFATDRERWSQLLGEPPDWAPAYRDWPELLGALRRILRWLQNTDLASMSEYLRGSVTRDLLESVAPDLSYAGVPIDYGNVIADPWEALEQTIDQALRALAPTGQPRRATEAVELLDVPQRAAAKIEVFRDSGGSFRWRLKAANGQVVATSGERYDSQRSAIEAARQFRVRVEDLMFDVVEHGGGTFAWRARAPSGRVLAEAADRFSSRVNAQRAAKRMRDVAREAR